MKILVSGAGIAGLTLALCLARRDQDVTVIEKTPAIQGRGYMIDFFGPGYDAAESLGLIPDLERIHDPISYLSFVDSRGREKFSLAYMRLRKLFNNRHFNFLRGDLQQLLYRQVEDRVEVRFGRTLVSCDQTPTKVCARLSDGAAEDYDVVVGADGVHSHTRKLVFGEETRFIRFLGYYAAAFFVHDAARLGLPADRFRTMSSPGRQVAAYPVRGGDVATFFVYPAERALKDIDKATARKELLRVFGSLDWIVPDLLAYAITQDEIYFDSVSQIQMPVWHKGRMVLLGDACQCLSLLAGQGASMAMAGASVLAEELSAGEAQVEAALDRYEKRVKPAVLERQASAVRLARWFVPGSRMGLALRDLLTRSAVWPGASLLLKRSFARQIKL